MGALETVRDTRSQVWLRGLNVLLGAWLFVSTFLWKHQGNVGFNNMLCGLAVTASALCAIWAPAFRWVNAGIAVWLGFCALIFDYASPVTRLHDLAVAGAIFAIALVDLPAAPVGELQVAGSS
jgi:hypothetical protein